MAGRIISQIVIIGTRVVSRAFVEAYKQAQASSKYAAAQGATAGTAKAGVMSDRQFSGLSLSEACSILDVKKPSSTGELTGLTMEEVADRYKRLFDQNDPKKGGSFYIQSKVVRAKERIENQMRIEERKAAEKEAMQPPKMYKE